jgi:predicted PurR-regulated permease PerM
LLLVLTSIVLALSLNIIVCKLCNLGVKRTYAVLISFLALFFLLGMFLVLVVPSLLSQFQQLSTLVPQGINKVIVELDKLKNNLSPYLNESLPNLEQLLRQLQPIFNDLLSRGFSFISGFLGNLLSSLLLLALTLMILVEPISYRNGFIRLFPNFYRPRVNYILFLCEQKLQEWLIDTFFRMLSIIVLSYLILFFLGIPLVSAQSLLAGFLSFIPYLGPFISIISPVAIAFLNAQWKAWLLIIIYLAIYQIIENIIITKLRKNKIILAPFNVMLGEVFFASFLGFLGLLLATPLTIVTEILVKEILIKDIFDQWELEK